MARIPSKNATKASKTAKVKQATMAKQQQVGPAKKTPRRVPKVLRKAKRGLQKVRVRVQDYRAKHPPRHKSFKRSYREDYLRKTETPGLLSHAMTTFQIIFRNWKTFVPFILLMTVLYVGCVGLLSEDLYQQFKDTIDETSGELANGQIGNFAKAGLLLISTVTTGGLDTGMGEVQTVFMVVLFLVMWLVTIFLLRHFFSGSRPRLRDALYNALSPLISTLLIFVVAFLQAIPIMLVLITYAAAVATNFLATPFYALLYFIFVMLMLLLSGYMLSGTLMALVAVTAPGMYPMEALTSTAELVSGRRIRLILRVLYLLFVIALVYIITMLPVILIDLWLKEAWEWAVGWPIVSFCLVIVTCFVFIYATTYLYRYYRWLLDYKEK